MKIELKERDKNLIDRVSDIVDENYFAEIDNEGYIDIDYIIQALANMEDKYIEMQEKYDRLKNKENVREHFMSESFNRGFHPDDYE